MLFCKEKKYKDYLKKLNVFPIFLHRGFLFKGINIVKNGHDHRALIKDKTADTSKISNSWTLIKHLFYKKSILMYMYFHYFDFL